MKRCLILTLGLILFFSQGMFSARAIENAVSAKDSIFVVPLWTQTKSSNFGISCSGSLIAPSIVVTAGHCVLDENGILSKRILVGKPGTAYLAEATATWIEVASIQITSTFQNATGMKVGNDDVVFLNLKEPLALEVQVRFASESEIGLIIKNEGKVRFFGYGVITDLGEKTIYPNSLEANVNLPNTGPIRAEENRVILKSNIGGACSGDSGGPIYSISALEVIIIGVITGGLNSKSCARKESDGFYYIAGTLVNRYTNLAFTSAVIQMKQDKEKNKLLSDAASADLAERENTIEDLQTQISDLETKIADLELLVTKLKAKTTKKIICIKGKVIKEVAGVNPKCPAGYKKK